MQLRNIKELIAGDDAVSPVIGVVLMVAITVILAAVIGSFVIGLGSSANSTPQASFSFEYNTSANNVTITHDGGDTLDAANLAIQESNTIGSNAQVTGTGEITAGVAVADGEPYESGETIKVVYNAPNSDKSATLATSTAP